MLKIKPRRFVWAGYVARDWRYVCTILSSEMGFAAAFRMCLEEALYILTVVSCWKNTCIYTLKMEAIWTSEMVSSYHIITRRQNPQDHDMKIKRLCVAIL